MVANSTHSPTSPANSQLDALAIVGGTTILAAIVVGSQFAAAEYGQAITRNTIRLSLAWYALALFLMMRLSRSDWATVTLRGRLARWCWTWGLFAFLVHLAAAFHYFHQWSHAHAFEHTRQVSGWGEGIYLSYLFTLLWAADTVWWWLLPSAYAVRSEWLHRALHAFMLFIAFNSTVVFETGPIRWAAAAGTAALAIAWLVKRQRTHVAPQGPS